MSLHDYDHEYCDCGCGERIPNYVRGVYYATKECMERAEGVQIDADPARDTIACVLAVEIAEEGRDTLVDPPASLPDAGGSNG